MANALEVKKQIHQAGFKNNYWGWSAIRQLPMILGNDENVERIATGMYSDGHAVIVATNKRMIILDKKPMSFRAEDIHYEMVVEVEHYIGPFAAKLRIHCMSKSLEFTSLRAEAIQAFAIHVDQKINKTRLNMSNVTTWSHMLESANGRQPRDINQRGVARRLGLSTQKEKTSNVGEFVHKHHM